MSSGGTQEMSDSPDTQDPSTQPMDDIHALHNVDNSWAKLMPIDPHFTAVSLQETETSLGRLDDKVPTPPQGLVYIGRSDWEFNAAISKRHFRIVRETTERGDDVWITDTSSNGTFVNGERLPKNSKRPLPPNAEISIALARNKAKARNKRSHIPVFIFYKKELEKMYPDDLTSQYVITRELGRGAMGRVMHGFRKTDNGSVAVKEVLRNKFNPLATKQLEREVEILKAVRHPAIVAVEQVFDDARATYIVMEILEGGELFDRIVANKRLPEHIVKLYAIQMLEALKYLHAASISHRDLKPENVLIKDPHSLESAIKVSDFGLAKVFEGGSMMRTYCGTPNYLAPEILASGGTGAYTNAVDLWSLGVILFVSLAGYPPFSKDYKDITLEKQILTGRIKFVDSCWRGVSEEAVGLVKALIVVNPEERLSAVEALAHPWIARDEEVKAKARRIMFPEEDSGLPKVRKRGNKIEEMEVENAAKRLK